MPAEIDLVAGLTAGLDRVAVELERQRERQQRIAQDIHPFIVPVFQIALSSGAGTLNQPNAFGPQVSNYWDVHRIQCTDFTAGTVTVYLNIAGAEKVAVFATAGVLLVGTAQILLGAGDTLVFVASGITGSVNVSVAGVEVAARSIGDYLQ